MPAWVWEEGGSERVLGIAGTRTPARSRLRVVPCSPTSSSACPRQCLRAVLRMTTAGIAARLDFTLDDIEDLRMAVGRRARWCSPDADPDGQLTARATSSARTASSSGLRRHRRPPQPPDSQVFAWQVLSTMASDVRAEVADSRLSIRLAVTATNGRRPG